MTKTKAKSTRKGPSPPAAMDKRPLPQQQVARAGAGHGLASDLFPSNRAPAPHRAANVMRASASGTGSPRRARMMKDMQHIAGSTRVSRMFGGAIQPKLTVSVPGDTQEQEANEVADHVMRMPTGSTPRRRPELSRGVVRSVQRACACADHGGQECPECGKRQTEEAIHRQADTGGKSADVPAGADSSNASAVASGIGPGLGGLLPSFSLPSLVPPACNPATSLLQASLLHTFVTSTFIPFSLSVFGPQTTGLWRDYLNSALPLPRPARSFSGGGEIVDGFTKHHKSTEAEKEIVDASTTALSGPSSSLMPAPGASSTVPVTSVVAPSTLHTRINDAADPMGLNYDSPATTIPGNIAGGIGSGGPPGNTKSDPDTRDVDGSVRLDLDKSGTNLTITPLLMFKVHDTVDFCPGALGGKVARVETVPMSVLEATEGRFGPIFAADVPFDVTYPGPAVAKVVSVTPPAPTPTPPTPTFPQSGPAKTTGSLLRVRTGPGLHFPALRLLGDRGTPIDVITQVHGDSVDGNDAWDQIDGGFVSDRFVAFDSGP